MNMNKIPQDEADSYEQPTINLLLLLNKLIVTFFLILFKNMELLRKYNYSILF